MREPVSIFNCSNQIQTCSVSIFISGLGRGVHFFCSAAEKKELRHTAGEEKENDSHTGTLDVWNFYRDRLL